VKYPSQNYEGDLVQKRAKTFILAANIPPVPLPFGTSPSIGRALNANHRF
jgi:hypothetical protein